MTNHNIIEDPRPWAFGTAELTAGLRRFTGDPTLMIQRIEEQPLADLRPSVARVRGLCVFCEGSTGKREFSLVLKEAQQQGNTRAGTINAGRREILFYQNLAEQLPVRIPRLFAADPDGQWLLMNLLPPGRTLTNWRTEDYYLATDQLVALHDRFWGLGDDLRVYGWLARPLDADFQVHVNVAEQAAQQISAAFTENNRDNHQEIAQLLTRITANAEHIAQTLRGAPQTLLHGDYWPDNLHVLEDGSITVYDWQQVGIGPAILDVVTFVQNSLWRLEPLPVSAEEVIAYYRTSVRRFMGYTWRDEDWQKQWDYALLWSFIVNWIDILSSMPQALMRTRIDALERIWLTPIRRVIETYLPS
ncbi:MAG: hypothetical protein OHK0052_17030 [Anaerolineales bacterium]